MKVKLFFTVIFILIVVHSFAQILITGKLLTEDQKPIANVTVSYKKIGSAALLGFSKSDGGGTFKLTVKVTDVDSVQLDFNHLSYAKRSVHVVNASANYAYILKGEVRKIQEVKVADVPVYNRKDTINYDVASFTGKQDRVIADIIKKLPGIEMRGGQILYQGEPIQQYRVNGLDMMGGRYGLINQNLPAEAVLKVQILENHQPIKMLDKLVFSNRATLNLQLKKFTTTGTGKIGLGATPALWDANITPMSFAKTFQTLNSFQTNNVGDDVSQQLKPFYSGTGYFAARSRFSDGPSYLSIREVATPGFDQKKWLDNQIFLVSSNMIQKLKNGLEVKGNFSYFHDNRKRQGTTMTQYFTSDEVISNQEVVDNSYGVDELNIGVFVEKNESNVYFNNSTNYRKRWNNSVGNILFNENTPIHQDKNFSDEAFLNSFSLGRFIGKQLVNVTSKIEWHNTPQRLSVNPGQFESLINVGKPYDRMGQIVRFKSFNFENGLSLSRKIKRWTFSPSVNLNYNNSKLNSHIEVQDQDDIRVLDTGYFNDMNNEQLQLRLALQIGKEVRKFRYSFNLPFSQYYYNVKQQGIQRMKNEFRSSWNPSASVSYVLNGKNSIGTNLSGGRNFGGLDNFYNGYIISQYRSIQKYDVRLLKNEDLSTGIHYEYKNTLKANFANLGYHYTKSWRDYMFSTVLDSLGRSTTSINNQDAQSLHQGIRGGLSKFFIGVKTIAKLNGSLNWRVSDYLLNEALVKQHVNSQSFTFELINSSSSMISGDYRVSMGRTHNQLAGGLSNELLYNNHFFNLVFAPHDRHLITMSNSLYGNNVKAQKSQYFMDATYRFRLTHWRTDLELTGTNLLNNKNYLQQFSSDYELVQSYFELRPRQFLISMRFKI
ncbi:hypothetical protein ACFX5U_17150 [Sphingobacterium sp. SG20118]|uniref:hypothetical protein n=1 Tax=Sphingobacterium sp. SG20118 TaxID=3367156 RepID=UPI0037DFC266